jgi:hypothetical protein
MLTAQSRPRRRQELEEDQGPVQLRAQAVGEPCRGGYGPNIRLSKTEQGSASIPLALFCVRVTRGPARATAPRARGSSLSHARHAKVQQQRLTQASTAGCGAGGAHALSVEKKTWTRTRRRQQNGRVAVTWFLRSTVTLVAHYPSKRARKKSKKTLMLQLGQPPRRRRPTSPCRPRRSAQLLIFKQTL